MHLGPLVGKSVHGKELLMCDDGYNSIEAVNMTVASRTCFIRPIP